ncbi:MAG: hypothetical protein KBS76_02125 [Ruminococcus sp.]|nr:hypothetical protein [Candidatus Apopatosoma intestinale]
MIRNDLASVIERFRALYASRDPRTLVQVRGIAEYEKDLPRRPLNSWDFDHDLAAYLDFRAGNQITYWERRKTLCDDLLPTLAPWYGIAEHTAFLGGNVDFSATTSYHHPIMDDISEQDKLRLDEENVWLHRVTDGIAYYREHYGDRFIPRLRGADGPSDIANIVRGNDLFYDVYDEPDEVKSLLSFCADAMRFTLEKQREAAGSFMGGFVSGFEIWLPGNAIGHISEDASCMMSYDMYEELFLPALKKAVAGYDNVMLHTHSLGAKMLPLFAQVPEISVIELSSDPNAPRAVSIWREYEEVLRDKIVVVAPSREELPAIADLLSRNRAVVWYEAETRKEAEEAVAFVRNLSHT